MTDLILAATAFVLLHLLVSGTILRDAIVNRTGEKLFRGVFSLGSIALLVWMARAFNAAPREALWLAPAAARHAVMSLIWLGVAFAVIGLISPSQTSAAPNTLAGGHATPQGITRITRHPFLWGVSLWAIGHIVINGYDTGLVFFGTFLLVALAGTVSIDRKRARAYGADWRAYAAQSSNLPFAAIAAGRTRLAIGEIGWWRPLVAIVAATALMAGHRWIIGVPVM